MKALLIVVAFIASVAFAQAAQDQGEVGVITGMAGGTYAATGADLMILDDPKVPLRVLTIGGKGSLQNLYDILHLRGVDIGFVQSDALTYARQHELFSQQELASIRYIAKLYDEEVHVIAQESITTMADLQGKKINTDLLGSGSAMTADIILSAFGIQAPVSHMRQVDAIAALKHGDIDALIQVSGAPMPLIASIPDGAGLHFVPVHLTGTLTETYLPAELAHETYPNLIAAGEPPVETLAVGDVMAAYGWPRGSDRYRRVAVFTEQLFTRFPELLQPPRHPKWREVNLAARVPGWPRFPAAQELLDRRAEMDRLSELAAQRGIPLTEQQKENLFREFTTWQRAQAQVR